MDATEVLCCMAVLFDTTHLLPGKEPLRRRLLGLQLSILEGEGEVVQRTGGGYSGMAATECQVHVPDQLALRLIDRIASAAGGGGFRIAR
jgi:hypothetical protein